jgi:hypothetical protein
MVHTCLRRKRFHVDSCVLPQTPALLAPRKAIDRSSYHQQSGIVTFRDRPWECLFSIVISPTSSI